MVVSRLLYYITDRIAFPGDEPSRRSRLLEKIAEASLAGVDSIQLRERDLASRDMESLAREAVNVITQLRTENRELATALLINSRTDIALAVQADGVHLRSDDISPQEAKAIWENTCGRGRLAPGNSSRGPLIAASSHSPAEIAQTPVNAATLAFFAPVAE